MDDGHGEAWLWDGHDDIGAVMLMRGDFGSEVPDDGERMSFREELKDLCYGVGRELRPPCAPALLCGTSFHFATS